MLEIPRIVRLARTALLSLLESRAHHIVPAKMMPDGTQLQIEWRRRQVCISGETKANDLSVSFDNREGIIIGGKFDMQLQRPDNKSGIYLFHHETGLEQKISTPNMYYTSAAILRALPGSILEIVGAVREICNFLRTRDPATANSLRRKFNLIPVGDAASIIPEGLFSDGEIISVKTKTTIVIPIFNAAKDVENLLSRLHLVNYPIILIDDASTNPFIGNLLSRFLNRNKNAKIIRNKKNCGFVESANKGLEVAEGHIILLNSDAIPPKGDWVSRLLKPIANDPNVATVTPFSNNAEILSIPSHDNPSAIDGGIVETIDGLAATLSDRFSTLEVPTGIGFCMAMNRRFLDELGGFDSAFGRGYGEEVDWCQKAVSLGGRNVALASLFVGHKGGSSFGNQKCERIRAASQIISTRYPDYDASVQSWVKDATTQPQFIALSIAWLAAVATSAVPVFIAHSMGGGAETALQREICEELKTKPGVLVLRVGGPALWRIELKGHGFFRAGDASTVESVAALLAPLKQINLVYSCGVGGRHPRNAADLLLFLFDARCTLDIRIHDFFPVSPSWNLLDSSGRFDGIPDKKTTDSAHAVPALNRTPAISHNSWRALWAEVFELAQSITVFSKSSADLIEVAYPWVAKKISVRPHKLRSLPKPIQAVGSSIGVLGSLNKAKGAEVVQRLSLSRAHSRKIVVLGEMDGAFALKPPHVFHGRYEHERISELAEKYGIGLWLIPSICPETFSFATHEALATGLPVLAFARGAQGEAVATAANGHPINTDPDDITSIESLVEKVFLAEQSKRQRRLL